MDGGCAGTLGVSPGDGLAEGEIELEDARAWLEFAEFVDVGRGERGVGDADEGGYAGVEESCVGGG